MNLVKTGNNIDKLIAFTPSLDPSWRQGQRIFTPKADLEVVDVIETMQKDGWEIDGSYQSVDHMNRVNGSHIRLQNPGIIMGSNMTEGLATTTLSTALNNTSYETDTLLGALRLICTNGLVSMNNERMGSIDYTNTSEAQLKSILDNLNIGSQDLMSDYDKLKFVEMGMQQQLEFAKQALKLRGIGSSVDSIQLLNQIREEDNGNDVWRVFNRVQENLTQDNRLMDDRGRMLPGVNNPMDNSRVNTALSAMAFKAGIGVA